LKVLIFPVDLLQ